MARNQQSQSEPTQSKPLSSEERIAHLEAQNLRLIRAVACVVQHISNDGSDIAAKVADCLVPKAAVATEQPKGTGPEAPPPEDAKPPTMADTTEPAEAN